MLAHKAVHEGHVAAEVISGQKHFFDPKCIPSIAYTDPEIAWVGVTEKEAKEQGLSLADEQIDDILTYALFPQIGLKFIKNRNKGYVN